MARVALTPHGSVGGEIGVDPEVILQTSHGRRSIDVLKILQPEKANWECKLKKAKPGDHPLLLLLKPPSLLPQAQSLSWAWATPSLKPYLICLAM
jgi:hypothetical protein